MRLLRTDTLQLEDIHESTFIPVSYAILFHAWDQEEALYVPPKTTEVVPQFFNTIRRNFPLTKSSFLYLVVLFLVGCYYRLT
jgi:hypothetical protein